MAGRLRPDFLSRCKWDSVLKACTGYLNQLFVFGVCLTMQRNAGIRVISSTVARHFPRDTPQQPFLVWRYFHCG